MRREFERVTCPLCRRTISAYIPFRGDGTGLRLLRHGVIGPVRRGRVAPCIASGRLIMPVGYRQWALE